MKKQSRSTRRTNRARSVASASGLALILGLVNGAIGANVTDQIINPPINVGSISINSTAPVTQQASQFQNSSVTAPISNSPLFTSAPSSVVNPNGSTVTISANALLAEAISNSSLQTFTVGTIPAGNDFSIATGQATALTPGAVVTALITNSPAQIAFSNSTNTVTGNTIQADVTLNTSTASIDHTFVAGMATPTNGTASASGNSSPWDANAGGNVVIANAQLAIDSGGRTGSGATVDGSGVTVDANTVPMAPGDTITVSKNEIGASSTGNAASSTYSGDGVNFNGGVAVSSLQLNQESPDVPATNPTAHVTDSGIAVTTGIHPVAGTVTVSQNHTAAQTTGNTAVNGASLAATSVSGTHAAPALSVDTTVPGFVAAVGSSTTDGATLAVANAQRNNDAHLASTIEDSHITVHGANGGSGAISVVNNKSQASVSGNHAANGIAIEATDVDGASTGIANSQVNGNTGMVASNATNVQVSRGSSTQIAHRGAIVVDHNQIGSSAVGSAATNETSVTSSASLQSTGAGAAFATASKQRMHAASSVEATTTGNVEALLDNSVSGTHVNATITHNTLGSLAQGNVVDNSTRIASGAGSYGVSVDNAQEFALSSSSNASTSSALIGVTLKNAATPADSTVVVGHNALSAWANGNEAANLLDSTAGTTLDTGNWGPTPAGHQLSNHQFVRGAVDATTHATYVGIDAQGGVAGQSDALDNSLDATAIGNLADSGLTLAAGTQLEITPADVGLTNEQSTADNGQITATTSGDVGVKASGVGNGFARASRISDANVLGNTLGSTAIANQATNDLALTAGTTLSMNDASPELSNAQTSATGVSASTAGNIAVQASTGASLTSTSSISGDVNVLNNALSASAVANTARNTATLAALTMDPGVNATLVNDQTSSGLVGATTTGTFGIQATGGPSFGSNAVSDASNVSDNSLKSQAAGNQATNMLHMQASTMLSSVNGSLTNGQSTSGDVRAVSTGAAGVLASGAAVSNAINGNTSVSGNTFGATALGNQGASTLAMTTDAALSTSGTSLANTQTLYPGATVSASTGADIGITAMGGALSGVNTISGNATVQDNGMASAATGNLAANVLALAGGTTLDVSGSSALASVQTAGSVTAGTTGSFGIRATGPLGGGNTVSDDATVSGNQASSQATGNRAANRLAMTAGTGLTGDGDLSNNQAANDAIHATTTVDVGILATGTALANLVSGNTSVLDNTLSSAATGNFANNELAMKAGTLDAASGSNLSNTQTSGQSPITASTMGGIGIVASGGTGGSLANSLSGNNTTSGNAMTADAIANQAVNLLSMAADTTLNAGANTTLSNTQASGSAVDATSAGGVGMQASGSGSVGSVISGNASVLDNTLAARAGQNEAANTLKLDAGTLANAGTVALNSEQTATGSSTAQVTTNTDTVGIMATGTLGSMLGVATVTGNTLQSVAFANSATNLLSIDASTGNQANASVGNTQTNGDVNVPGSGAVTATTTLGGSLGVDVGGTFAGSVANVNGNQVTASAYGNSASNVLNANGGAGIPGYALAGTNVQTNSGAINAAVNGPSGSGASIGLNTGLASPGYTANVLGNTVASVAYGNTAYNQLNASSSVGMVPTSASLTSNQMNTANVTATVSNMGIGVVGSGLGSSSVISGNTVSSTAVGNASVNHMVIGN